MAGYAVANPPYGLRIDSRPTWTSARKLSQAGRSLDAARLVTSSLLVPLDHLQKRLPIPRQFDRAGAGDTGKLRHRPWKARGHFRKRLVVENHIGRHVLRPGQFQPFGAQLLEKRAVGGGKGLLRRATRGFPLAAGLLQGAQVQGRLLAQELAALAGDRQTAVARHVHRDKPMRDELADNRAPGVAVVLLADAESGELVMAQALDALVGLAEENRDDMRLPEALAGAMDAGQQLLGGDGAVEGFGRIETDIAIAARLAVVAEIAQ